MQQTKAVFPTQTIILQDTSAVKYWINNKDKNIVRGIGKTLLLLSVFFLDLLALRFNSHLYKALLLQPSFVIELSKNYFWSNKKYYVKFGWLRMKKKSTFFVIQGCQSIYILFVMVKEVVSRLQYQWHRCI